jgi:V8-like Glu-specific endopeptidase
MPPAAVVHAVSVDAAAGTTTTTATLVEKTK